MVLRLNASRFLCSSVSESCFKSVIAEIAFSAFSGESNRLALPLYNTPECP